jgi:hypothetical protein
MSLSGLQQGGTRFAGRLGRGAEAPLYLRCNGYNSITSLIWTTPGTVV